MQLFRAGSLSLTMPTGWEEVTLGQFLTLADPDAPTDAGFIITTLSGLTAEELRSQKAPLDLSHFVLHHLPYLSELPDAPDALPRWLTLEGHTTRLPTDLGTEATLGQMWDVDFIIASRQSQGLPVSPVSMARSILPVFLWPLLTDAPYTHHHAAAELWPRIATLPCIEGLSMAGFFLDNTLRPAPSGSISTSLCHPTPSMRWRPALRRVWTALTSTLRVSP